MKTIVLLMSQHAVTVRGNFDQTFSELKSRPGVQNLIL